MSISFVAEAHNTTGAAYGSSIVVNKPTGTADGDVMIAIVAGVQSGTPSGWTLVQGISVGSTGSLDHAYVYRKVCNSEPSSYTWTLSSSQLGCVSIVTYRGVDNTTPVDTTNKTITNVVASATFTPSSITASAGQWGIVFGAGYEFGSSTVRTYTETGSPTVTAERADFGNAVAANPDNTSVVVAEYASLSAGAFAPTITRSNAAANGARGSILLNAADVSAPAENVSATATANNATVLTGINVSAQNVSATATAFDAAAGVQGILTPFATVLDASVAIAPQAHLVHPVVTVADKGVNYGAPPGRTMIIGADTRTYAPDAESRSFLVTIVGND